VSEAIPVLMYHSVAPQIKGWAFMYLSLDPSVFVDHISCLASAGYRSLFLSDLHSYLSGRAELGRKGIVLTFDDGYLDNWVFAFPVLKKFGFKATIFVSTDFVDPRDVTRPTLDDVWCGRTTADALTAGGFLSAPEMRQLVGSGLIEIQGHCRSHTWHFTGDRVVDFHHPGDDYPWLGWNARPERKYLYLGESQAEFVPWGSPVYEYDKALVARRYFPDPVVETELAAHVAAHGGEGFFQTPDWKSRLFEVAARALSGAQSGRYETGEERAARLRDEIVSSKTALERMTGKSVDFLCWPNGAYDAAAVELAREAGFLGWTLGSKAVTTQRNVPGEDPQWIRRIAAAPWWYFRSRRISSVDGKFMRLMIDDYKGLAFASARFKIYKLRKLLASYLK
jgi:peptidoglycan/xylan/chitin deacetylase (PgdA/CDA1 family)